MKKKLSKMIAVICAFVTISSVAASALTTGPGDTEPMKYRIYRSVSDGPGDTEPI